MLNQPLLYTNHCATCRLQRADAVVADRDAQLKALSEQMARMGADYADLRDTHEALRAEHQGTGAKQQITVGRWAGVDFHYLI